MRPWWVGIVAMLAAPAAADQAQPSLKAFEFRGLVAGAPLTSEQLAKCKTYSDLGSSSCKTGDDQVAGVRMMSVGVWVANDKLSSVSIMADPIFFSVVTSAFKTKYGPPCKSALPKWVGELGNSRPNPTMTWCFKTGKMVAKMYGARLDVSEIDYTDANQGVMRKPEPKIDF